jgi:hypothetical protein
VAVVDAWDSLHLYGARQRQPFVGKRGSSSRPDSVALGDLVRQASPIVPDLGMSDHAASRLAPSDDVSAVDRAAYNAHVDEEFDEMIVTEFIQDGVVLDSRRYADMDEIPDEVEIAGMRSVSVRVHVRSPPNPHHAR